MASAAQHRISVADTFGDGDMMARRRLQKAGHLFIDGNWWRLRWREDVVEDGKLKRVRRSAIIAFAGKGGSTKKQAERAAWENILGRLDQFAAVPQSLMTLAQFVTQRFEPEHVWALKHAGKQHYKFCLGKILPKLGEKRLRDIRPADLQALVRSTIEAGLSTQTAAHLRNALSAIFKHAKQSGCYAGENPASLVRLPSIVPVRRSALSFDHAKLVLSRLPEAVRVMALLSMTTSLNVAELCGLRRGRVNATGDFTLSDGETIPPLSVAVRENYYRNRYGTVKTGSRERIVPIPDLVLPELQALMRASDFQSPDSPVFPARTGRPLDAHNINNRVFKAVAKAIQKELKLELKITWHIFRHSCATFAEQVGMAKSDRIALMGHAKGKMTDSYTHSDIERRRISVSEIARRLMDFGPNVGHPSEFTQ